MKFFRFFALLLLLAPAAFSQTPDVSKEARLTGTLTDPSGAGVGSVQIAAVPTEKSSGLIYKATSRTDGEYTFALPAGKYHVRFARVPFVERNFDLDLAPGETRRLDLRLKLEQLSASVVVTAQAEPLASEDSSAPVTVISRKEIEQRQAVSLPDLLAVQPGFALSRTGPEGGLATIFLDGGKSNFTKVLVDGTPVNEPGGFLNFSNFTLDNVDKVEVVHGAESALYGSDAVSGVIQIFTHRGTTRVPTFALFAEGGSFSSARGGAQLSGLLGHFDYAAAGAYFQTDGQGLNDSFLNRTFSGNMGWRFTESNRVRLTVRGQSSDAGTPGPTLLQPANLEASDALQILSANLSWDFHTGAHWEHRLSGTEARTLEVSVDPPFPVSTDAFNRAGWQEQSTYFLRSGSATGGYQYEVENGFPSLLAGEHARRNNQAGYLDARWSPHARITAGAGVRAEANEQFGTRVAPRTGASLLLRESPGFWGDTRLRASYGQGIKEPQFDETSGTDPCFPGNPNLRPERSRTVHAGIEQILASDHARVSTDYFNDRYEDMITFSFGPVTPACAFGTGTYFNTDLARARGATTTIEARPGRWLMLRGNYTYDDTRVLKAPNAFFAVELPGNRLLRRPVHSGSVMLNAAFHRMNWNLASYFSGKRADSDFSGSGLLIPNPGYARFDAATSYDFGRGLSFYGRVTNLFDKAYQDALGFPALGRDFRLGMRYRFGGRE